MKSAPCSTCEGQHSATVVDFLRHHTIGPVNTINLIVSLVSIRIDMSVSQTKANPTAQPTRGLTQNADHASAIFPQGMRLAGNSS